jgi:iron(III) transport system ATP-binding protein
MATVKVRGLVKRFEGGVTAVGGVSFEVGHGELVTLLGPSGCGKTTTLRLIAGLETPNAGEIAFDDQVVTAAERGVFVPPERRGAGMVFQSYAIWPHMTVFGNVAYPLRMQGLKGPEVRKRAEEALSLVGLRELKDRLATQLSGGQQQRTAIARAIVGQPGLLLLDEPLSNLDAMLRAQMRLELRQLQQQVGITAIYVTHDQTEAMVLSDRVIVMHAGQIQQIGTPREVYTRPANRFVAEFVGFANFIPGTVEDREDGVVRVRAWPGGPLLACRAEAPGGMGESVVLAARGSQVDLAPIADESAPNTLAGRVTQAIYLGDTTEYRIEAGPLAIVAALPERDAARPGAVRPAVGEQVAVRLAPDALVALKGE